jgi:hypothetical protein
MIEKINISTMNSGAKKSITKRKSKIKGLPRCNKAPDNYIDVGGGCGFSAANNIINALQQYKPNCIVHNPTVFNEADWKIRLNKLGKNKNEAGENQIIWPRLEVQQPLSERINFSEGDGAFVHPSAMKQLLSEKGISLKAVMETDKKRKFNLVNQQQWLVNQQKGVYLILISSKMYSHHFTVIDANKGYIVDSFFEQAIPLNITTLTKLIKNDVTTGDGCINIIYEAQWNDVNKCK